MEELPVVEVETSRKSYYKTIAQRVHEGGIMISNAMDPEILSIMTYVKYDAAAVKVGEILRNNAIAKINECQKELGEQLASTETVEEAFAEVAARYIPRMKLARVVFEHDLAALSGLDLIGRRKSTGAAGIQQARMFYDNLFANSKWMTQMESLSMSEDLLNEDKLAVQNAEKAMNIQKNEIGDVLTATVHRDIALENLFDWMHRYKKVALVALGDYPKLIEKLGIKAN